MIDLFDTPENIPFEVQEILNSFEDNTYQECERVQRELNAIGYDFEYGLDAEPYGLTKIDTLKELFTGLNPSA